AAEIALLVGRRDRGAVVVDADRDRAVDLADERMVRVDAAVEDADSDVLTGRALERPLARDALRPLKVEPDVVGRAGRQRPRWKRALLCAFCQLLSLRFPEPLRHHLEHVPRNRRVRLHERLEVPGRHSVAAKLGLRSDGRRPIDVGDQPDLAEIVPWSEYPDFLAADAHFCRAVADNKEADAALALLGHSRANVERALFH